MANMYPDNLSMNFQVYSILFIIHQEKNLNLFNWIRISGRVLPMSWMRISRTVWTSTEVDQIGMSVSHKILLRGLVHVIVKGRFLFPVVNSRLIEISPENFHELHPTITHPKIIINITVIITSSSNSNHTHSYIITVTITTLICPKSIVVVAITP